MEFKEDIDKDYDQEESKLYLKGWKSLEESDNQKPKNSLYLPVASADLD